MVRDMKTVRCRCGGVPIVCIDYAVETGLYQGHVDCPECGGRVRGVLHVYDKNEAAEDAVEEWNKIMFTSQDREKWDDR